MEQAQKVAEQIEETAKPQNEELPVRTRGINELTRSERELLNNVSKEVFGSSSRWQKLVNNGVARVVTEEVTELVPNETDPEGEPTERKVQVPVKTGNGALQSTIKRYTVSEVLALMIELKQRRDAHLAKVKEAQEKAALEKKLQEEVSGSAGL
jgi:hypothetical protein